MNDFLFTPELIIAQIKENGSFDTSDYSPFISTKYWVETRIRDARRIGVIMYCPHPDATYQCVDVGPLLEIVQDYLKIIDPIETIWGTV